MERYGYSVLVCAALTTSLALLSEPAAAQEPPREKKPAAAGEAGQPPETALPRETPVENALSPGPCPGAPSAATASSP